MSLIITRGLGDGHLITKGLGVSSQLVQMVSGWFRKWILHHDIKTFVTIKIVGNNEIPININKRIVGNYLMAYKTNYNVLGNNSVPIVIDLLRICGNNLIPFTTKIETKGKKSFMKLIVELLFDDDDN